MPDLLPFDMMMVQTLVGVLFGQKLNMIVVQVLVVLMLREALQMLVVWMEDLEKVGLLLREMEDQMLEVLVCLFLLVVQMLVPLLTVQMSHEQLVLELSEILHWLLFHLQVIQMLKVTNALTWEVQSLEEGAMQLLVVQIEEVYMFCLVLIV